MFGEVVFDFCRILLASAITCCDNTDRMKGCFHWRQMHRLEVHSISFLIGRSIIRLDDQMAFVSSITRALQTCHTAAATITLLSEIEFLQFVGRRLSRIEAALAAHGNQGAISPVGGLEARQACSLHRTRSGLANFKRRDLFDGNSHGRAVWIHRCSSRFGIGFVIPAFSRQLAGTAWRMLTDFLEF